MPGPLAIISAPATHYIALTPGNGVGRAGVSQMMRLYADPGAKVTLTLFPSTNAATVACSAAISGYLVTP